MAGGRCCWPWPATGALCSFGFGWSGELSPVLLLAFAALYGFTALGDSSVLSTAMSEAVPAAVSGARAGAALDPRHRHRRGGAGSLRRRARPGRAGPGMGLGVRAHGARRGRRHRVRRSPAEHVRQLVRPTRSLLARSRRSKGPLGAQRVGERQPGLVGPAKHAVLALDQELEHPPRHRVVLVQPAEREAGVDQRGHDLADRMEPFVGSGIAQPGRGVRIVATDCRSPAARARNRARTSRASRRAAAPCRRAPAPPDALRPDRARRPA